MAELAPVDESRVQHIFKIQFSDEPDPTRSYCGLVGKPLPESATQVYCAPCVLAVLEVTKKAVQANITFTAEIERHDERIAAWFESSGLDKDYFVAHDIRAARYMIPRSPRAEQ